MNAYNNNKALENMWNDLLTFLEDKDNWKNLKCVNSYNKTTKDFKERFKELKIRIKSLLINPRDQILWSVRLIGLIEECFSEDKIKSQNEAKELENIRDNISQLALIPYGKTWGKIENPPRNYNHFRFLVTRYLNTISKLSDYEARNMRVINETLTEAERAARSVGFIIGVRSVYDSGEIDIERWMNILDENPFIKFSTMIGLDKNPNLFRALTHNNIEKYQLEFSSILDLDMEGVEVIRETLKWRKADVLIRKADRDLKEFRAVCSGLPTPEVEQELRKWLGMPGRQIIKVL